MAIKVETSNLADWDQAIPQPQVKPAPSASSRLPKAAPAPTKASSRLNPTPPATLRANSRLKTTASAPTSPTPAGSRLKTTTSPAASSRLKTSAAAPAPANSQLAAETPPTRLAASTNTESAPTKKSATTKTPPPKVTPRSLLTQSLIFWGVTIGAGLLFVFAFLPLIIKVTGAAKMSAAPAPVVLDFPQVPILNAPPEHISTHSLTITGFGEPGSKVYFILDGQRNDRLQTKVSDQGEFHYDLDLSSESAYQLTAYSISTQGQESNLSKVYPITVDTTTPTLTLDDLKDGSEIVGKPNQQLEIKGTTEPKAKVYLNDRPVTANSEGEFRHRITLNEGDNTFTLRAQDQAGNESTQTLTVKFTP